MRRSIIGPRIPARMRRPFKAWLVVLGLLSVGLTGCWSNRPVESRAIVLTLGIAPGPKQGLEMYFQIPTRTGLLGIHGGGAEKNGAYVVKATGLSPGAALIQAQGQVQQDLYLGEIQVVVMSARLSKTQFHNAEAWLVRLGPMDKTAYIVATPSIKAFMAAAPANGELAAIDLERGFSCSGCETVRFNQHLWDVEMAVPSPGLSVWMPWVTVTSKGLDTNRVVAYAGSLPAIVLSPLQTEDLGYVLGRTGKGYLSYRWRGAVVGIRTVTSSPRHRTTLSHGHMVIRLHIGMKGVLDNWTGSPLTPALVATIEHHTASLVTSQILAVLVALQRKGSDPVGFGQSLIWKRIPAWRPRPTWEKAYQAASIRLRVDFHFTSVGDSN